MQIKDWLDKITLLIIIPIEKLYQMLFEDSKITIRWKYMNSLRVNLLSADSPFRSEDIAEIWGLGIWDFLEITSWLRITIF
jgi:hypothetical protein